MPPSWVKEVVTVFQDVKSKVDTVVGKKNKSNEVLAILRPGLEAIGFLVESGTQSTDKIRRPVLFGELGQPSLTFEIDAFREEDGIVLEVEAGRSIHGNAIYRDLVRMSVMVDASSAVVAAPIVYRYQSSGRPIKSNTYEKAKDIFDAVYASGRLKLPFEGALLIGY